MQHDVSIFILRGGFSKEQEKMREREREKCSCNDALGMFPEYERGITVGCHSRDKGLKYTIRRT